MQQTLVGCAFCDAPPGTETGEAHTGGQDDRVTHPICVGCATQTRSDPDERDHHACDGCGLVVDAFAALTRFRVELGHLEGPSEAHIVHTKMAKCVGSQCTHYEHR